MGIMSSLVITPDNVDDLEEAGHYSLGPVVIEQVEDFSWDDLNSVRYFLSMRLLGGEAVIEGETGTVDELVDWVVAQLAKEKPGMRLHAPQYLTQEELAQARTQLDVAGDYLFYLDGEEDPFDSGLLYDRYEDALFEEEW